MSYLYMASPYTHPEAATMDWRYAEALRATAWLLNRRTWVYSPIVHCHELAKAHKLPRDFTFWKDYNYAMLDAAKGLLVLALDGWQESQGVSDEIDHVWQRPIPVTFLSWHDGAYEHSNARDL